MPQSCDAISCNQQILGLHAFGSHMVFIYMASKASNALPVLKRWTFGTAASPGCWRALLLIGLGVFGAQIANPDAGGNDFIEALSPESFRVVTAFVEPFVASVQPEQKYELERFGFFCGGPGGPCGGRKSVLTRLRD